MMPKYPATIITDLDGCLIRHARPTDWFRPVELLPDTLAEMTFWLKQGCAIVIMTGRPEDNRRYLEDELHRVGIPWHRLVMGVTSGTRILINDRKPYDLEKEMAVAINVIRNEGITRFNEILDAHLR